MVLAGRPASAGDADPSAPQAPGRAECVASHQRAQELKRKGQLVEAQGELATCSSAGCPGAIISDCGQWIADLEQTTPSMVFEVRLDGRQATDFKVNVDGTLVADLSKAYKVNPGRHVVRVELPAFEGQEQTVVLPEGQRMRLVSFEFKSQQVDAPPPATSAPATTEPPTFVASRPTPVVVYPLLGVAVAGFGAFGVFSLLGHSKQGDLEEQCEPNCTDSDLSAMKRNYLIGDISAGVGAAALISAGIIYLARPTQLGSEAATSVSVGPASARDLSSFALSVRRSF